MTPTLYTGWWFNGSSGQSSFSWTDYKLGTNANLFVSPKRWNPLFPSPAPFVKPTMKTNVFKKMATNSQRGVVHWVRSCSVPCPLGICSWDRSCQALRSWINAARRCKVFHTCWSQFPTHVWGPVACTEGWRPVGDRKTYREHFRSEVNSGLFWIIIKSDGLFILTISYRARERALWKRENSLQSCTVMTNFQTASSTTPTRRILPTTASRTIRTSVPVPHSERTKVRFVTTIRIWNQHLSNLLFPLAEKDFYLLLCTKNFSDNTGRGDGGWMWVRILCHWGGPSFLTWHTVCQTTSRISSILGKMR